MKILLSAIACSPVMGSEPFVGWNSAVALASRHKIWVLTNVQAEEAITDAQKNGAISASANFVFLGRAIRSQSNEFIARMQSWREYHIWQHSLLEVAKGLHRNLDFDLVHQVTYASWRVGSPLDSLGIPFVWGPIGGGEVLPLKFLPLLSLNGCAYEILRKCSTQLALRSKSVKRTARQAAHIFTSNEETERTIVSIRGTKAGVSQLCQIFFREKHLERFAALLAGKRYDGPLRLFGGGSLDARKGFSLALRALSVLKQNGGVFRYTIAGWGPERTFLQKLVANLTLTDSVEIVDGLSGEKYTGQLLQTHIYLVPSLRDSAGATLMEAMLAGCVPIVIGSGGPGRIVDDASGVRIEPRSPLYVIQQIVEALLSLDVDRNRIAEMAGKASLRIQQQFSDRNYLEAVESVYGQVAK